MKNVMGKNQLKAKIRKMNEKDLEAVAALEREIFPDPWPFSAFEDILDETGWVGLVAESNGTIIGYGCYLIVLDEAHLANIAVTEAYRRKSVAKKILERILRDIKRKKCQVILLEVRPSNAAAIAFYERFGFIKLYRRPDYYHHPREDAQVMVLNLINGN